MADISNNVPITNSAWNLAPVSDNELDTAIRTGVPGVSLNYAREDHNHAIRRQGLPATPVMTAFGTGMTLVSQSLQRSATDEESVEYVLFVNTTHTASNARHWLNIPSIAWFQAPIVRSLWTYRQNWTSTGMTPAPTMWNEVCVYAWGSVYIWPLNRTQALTYYITLSLKYTRV